MINMKNYYTVEVKVSVLPSYYHTLTLDVFADSVVDAFAIARQAVWYVYQYEDDCIISENLIGKKTIYSVK